MLLCSLILQSTRKRSRQRSRGSQMAPTDGTLCRIQLCSGPEPLWPCSGLIVVVVALLLEDVGRQHRLEVARREGLAELVRVAALG
eukprot:647032-Alexandrium_andersonii.AAC.1